MRFLGVSFDAVEEIISDRFLQSADFEPGLSLVNFLNKGNKSSLFSKNIEIILCGEGFVLETRGDKRSHYVLFDIEEGEIFNAAWKANDVLMLFQKTLRFCMKVWSNLKPAHNEHFLNGSTKAVVFPFPFSQKTSVRVTIELAPDSKRLSRRGEDKKFMLVYRCGTSDAGGPQEEVRVTNFRKFWEALPSVSRSATKPPEALPTITSLAVTALDTPQGKLEPYQGYERWLQLLTSKQCDFVRADLKAPHRIEGPAGTGKTLCLILKCITGLRKNKELNLSSRYLFVTHSEATKRAVQSIFEVNDQDQFYNEGVIQENIVKVITLQKLCGELLRQDISDSEFVDRDAMESKQLQLLYVHEAFTDVMKTEFQTHSLFLSSSFLNFIKSTDEWTVVEMMQHEISVVIKGRAEEKFDNYKKLPALKYGLPIETQNDRSFVWQIFKKYQKQLQKTAQFDTDDIVLTTIGQLNTPIWRRRRLREGYDAIFIDETHLFNLNELSLFHHLPKDESLFPIAYSVDRSQAIGDRGWADESFDAALSDNSAIESPAAKTEVVSVFRCSPEIVDLAFSVTSSGATLFTNFHDPLKLASSTFTAAEERKCAPPILWTSRNDSELVEYAFVRAERLSKEMDVARGNIAIVAFSDELFRMAQKYGEENHKPIEILKERGDTEAVKRALSSGRYLLTAPDYVGGLEFFAVVLVGVDEGRVPPIYTLHSADSRNFLSYASHNRLYVSITRARYRVEIIISRERGSSPLLRNALTNHLLIEREAESG